MGERLCYGRLAGVARVDPRVRRADALRNVATTCSRPSRWLADRRRAAAEGAQRHRNTRPIDAAVKIGAGVLLGLGKARGSPPPCWPRAWSDHDRAHRSGRRHKAMGSPAGPFRQEPQHPGRSASLRPANGGRHRSAGGPGAPPTAPRSGCMTSRRDQLAAHDARESVAGGVAQPLTPIRTQRDVRTMELWLPARRRPECALVGR